MVGAGELAFIITRTVAGLSQPQQMTGDHQQSANVGEEPGTSTPDIHRCLEKRNPNKVRRQSPLIGKSTLAREFSFLSLAASFRYDIGWGSSFILP